MKKSVLIVIGVLLVAAGLFGGWTLGRQDEAVGGSDKPPARAPAVSGPIATEKSAARATPAPAASPRTAVPSSSSLPVVLDDRPLVEQLPDLDARARQGDALAACDIGVALAHCLRFTGRAPPLMSAEYIARQPAKEQTQLTEMTARMGARFERIAAACTGIERETHLPLAQQYLLAAAQRGNTHARAEFVKFPLGVADLIRMPALGQLYAANAPRLFDAMWADGDVAAIEVINQASMTPGMEMQRAAAIAVPEDLRNPQLARALRERLMRATLTERQLAAQPPRPPGYTPPPIDPEVIAQAERFWNERFEHSDSIAALRGLRDRAQAGTMPAFEKAPLFPGCEGR
jgi:hypothetical protein